MSARLYVLYVKELGRQPVVNAPSLRGSLPYWALAWMVYARR